MYVVYKRMGSVSSEPSNVKIGPQPIHCISMSV